MRIKSFADVIALIPTIVGYVPAERVVCVYGKDSTILAACAADFPQSVDGMAGIAKMLIERGVDIGAEDAYLVIYSNADVVESGLMALAFSAITGSKLHIKGMASVTDSYWRDYHDPETERDLDEIRDSQLAAALVFEGHDIAPADATIPAADLSTMTLSLAALNFRATLPPMNATALSDNDLILLTRAWMLWTKVLARGGELEEREATDLIGYFQHPMFRDMFITYITSETMFMTEEQVSERLGAMFENGRTEWIPRAAQIRDTMTQLLRWTQDDLRTDVLATLGFSEWFLGHGFKAAMYFDRALELQPGARLPRLLKTAVERGFVSKAVTTPEAAQYSQYLN